MGGKSGDETFRLAFGIGLRVPNVRSGSILRYFFMSAAVDRIVSLFAAAL